MSSTPFPAGPERTATRRVVLVAGAGRSGTSTLAGVLAHLGLHVPRPEVAPDDTNPRGFSESQWVVDFHDELLAKVHVQVGDARPQAWQRTSRFAERERPRARLEAWLADQFTQADHLLVKDPRLTWFLDLWRAAVTEAGAEPAYATMLRPLPEVVGSRRASYNRGLDDAHGAAAWLNMMLNTERATRGHPRVFVRYSDLLADWRAVVRRTGTVLALPEVADPDPAVADRIDAFVDPSLRRVQQGWDDLVLPARLRELASESWVVLAALAGGEGNDPSVDAVRTRHLDELHEAFDAYYAEAEAVSLSSVIAAREEARDKARPNQPAGVEPRPAVVPRVWARLRTGAGRLRSRGRTRLR